MIYFKMKMNDRCHYWMTVVYTKMKMKADDINEDMWSDWMENV